MNLGRQQIVELLRSGQLVVDPISPGHLQPAGIQLSLGKMVAKMKLGQIIDPASGIAPEFDTFEIGPAGLPLAAGEFLLGHTLEKLAIPGNMLAMIDGRSTMGRIGIVPHTAAMAIWPGHGKGPLGPRQITLEIKNHADCTVVLRPGLFIANMTFQTLETPVEHNYDSSTSSKYSADQGIMLPRFDGEFVNEAQFVRDLAMLK